jgi:hypothetical protein
MSDSLIKYADTIRAKYLFEIDRPFNIAEFIRKKFKNDQKNIKKFRSIIYKKYKK